VLWERGEVRSGREKIYFWSTLVFDYFASGIANFEGSEVWRLQQADAVPLIIFEFADVAGTVRCSIYSLPIEVIILELSYILGTVRKEVGALPMHLIVFVFAIVFGSIGYR